MPEPEEQQDKELEAIRAVISSLQSLDEAARKRVLAYVLERLSIQMLPTSQHVASRYTLTPSSTKQSDQEIIPIAATDIRKLKEEKLPESTIEMAVLVAYYLSELAPPEDRKSSVNSNDLVKYFKQAKYPLPKSIKDVLPNTKYAGFVESVSQGEYKLNSVGYNLAVHGLPKKKTSRAH